MSRLKELRKLVDRELLAMEDPDRRRGAYAHLYGVSLAASLVAEKRRENAELACMEIQAALHPHRIWLAQRCIGGKLNGRTLYEGSRRHEMRLRREPQRMLRKKWQQSSYDPYG